MRKKSYSGQFVQQMQRDTQSRKKNSQPSQCCDLLIQGLLGKQHKLGKCNGCSNLRHQHSALLGPCNMVGSPETDFFFFFFLKWLRAQEAEATICLIQCSLMMTSHLQIIPHLATCTGFEDREQCKAPLCNQELRKKCLT